ncbi:flagellar basal body rod C-terminal domain-containing protein [Alicyclobacillus vulcanalis]|uniref:Flagellar basal body rod FlgEFG protein C-terminal n=1 Tax=Alicyclobacillus vulcanalis TaxID=252246 RepID=A0A1N7LES0_9BACL|nr:flagellar basal body rod C-terminal domain-containing protein [Alicyclobacillus vulcanalis]SIS72310.1 Flagellar basal body rod FlgEFG protein C-terminal [Alicyclobacillus vulcanalis]
MIQGLTAAASGMAAEDRLAQLLSNNLANQETPGFKASLAELIEDPVFAMERYAYGDGADGTSIGQMGGGVDFQEGVPSFVEGGIETTGRPLDVAIVDSIASGEVAYAFTPQGARPVSGTVQVGPGGRLTVGGLPLAVYGADGQPVAGLYAVRNPLYQGSELLSQGGGPTYDAAGRPSYIIENAAGQAVYVPGSETDDPYAIRVGNADDMGYHAFLPVNYTDASGQAGLVVTRDGALQLNAQNVLVDAAGHAIAPVNAAGQVIVGGRLVVNPLYHGTQIFSESGAPVYDANGQPSFRVYDAQGKQVAGGRLGLVDADVTQLEPLGEGEYMVGSSYQPQAVTPLLRAGTGRMVFGALESSNVNVAATMAQMMQAVNAYEANQRVAQSVDSMLNEAVTDVGKVQGG